MTKIAFTPLNIVSDDTLRRNRNYAHGLGLPEVGTVGPVARSLAIVGGGPSVNERLAEIKAFDGEIWAINGAAQWCRSKGIKPTLYMIDPLPRPDYCVGIWRAVLADTVDPAIFKALKGAWIELARIGDDAIPHWTTAASSGPAIAGERGHKRIVLYGCESSYSERTHAYKDESGQWSKLWVYCGGEEYLTTPQFIMQAEYLAELARAAPRFIEVRGDGFLPALIEHGDYEVTHVSRDLSESLTAAQAAEQELSCVS